MNCIFCEIINRQQPAKFVFENDELVAINDLHPKAPIHILLIPKTHIASAANLDESNKDLIASLILKANDLASQKKIKGYKLIFNVGREGGQIIDHLHLHLLGGWERSPFSIEI